MIALLFLILFQAGTPPPPILTQTAAALTRTATLFTQTSTPTLTRTLTPSPTRTLTFTPIPSFTSTPAFTSTPVPLPTFTPTPIGGGGGGGGGGFLVPKIVLFSISLIYIGLTTRRNNWMIGMCYALGVLNIIGGDWDFVFLTVVYTISILISGFMDKK